MYATRLRYPSFQCMTYCFIECLRHISKQKMQMKIKNLTHCVNKKHCAVNIEFLSQFCQPRFCTCEQIMLCGQLREAITTRESFDVSTWCYSSVLFFTTQSLVAHANEPMLFALISAAFISCQPSANKEFRFFVRKSAQLDHWFYYLWYDNGCSDTQLNADMQIHCTK